MKDFLAFRVNIAKKAVLLSVKTEASRKNSAEEWQQ
jgi:hypothetical protein